jgi:phage N-6-adenine-methyltransferase
MKIAATLASARVAGSTSRDDWQTPAKVWDRIRGDGGATVLDPCTSDENPLGADGFFTEWSNGLVKSWQSYDLVYVNFPYSKAKLWADKILVEAAEGVEVITLCPARPDSKWFFRLAWDSAAAICFWRGRLRFVGAPSSAPFPSAVLYHGRHPDIFAEAFGDAGKIVVPSPPVPSR